MSKDNTKLAEKKLSARQALFVGFFVGQAQFNGALAARMAGYAEDSAKQTAVEILSYPYVQSAVEKYLPQNSEIFGRIWDFATDPTIKPYVRLRALELAAKCKGMLNPDIIGQQSIQFVLPDQPMVIESPSEKPPDDVAGAE